MSYAVLFTSKLAEIDEQYQELNDTLYQALMKQEGYLGHESYRNEQGVGCTISYWKDLDALKKWKEFPMHLQAQLKGKEKWYDYYQVKICKIEKEYEWEKEKGL